MNNIKIKLHQVYHVVCEMHNINQIKHCRKQTIKNVSKIIFIKTKPHKYNDKMQMQNNLLINMLQNYKSKSVNFDNIK